MKNKCAKCKTKDSTSSIYVEAGNAHVFCKQCSDILDDLPTNNVTHFVEQEKVENAILKNIKEAKERRARGESLWN